jgi:hypothetical protein
MTNIFNGLEVEEPSGIVIDTENQLRNCKKKLKNKKKRYTSTLDEEIKEEIRILESVILEYENRHNHISKRNKKKKKCLLNNDHIILNEAIKQNKMFKIKQRRTNELWSKYVNKKNKYESPKWSIQTHTLFPDYMKKIIIGLFCYNMNEDTIFSILPKEVMDRIVKEFKWFDFHDKDKDNEIVIENGSNNVHVVYKREKWRRRYGSNIIFN